MAKLFGYYHVPTGVFLGTMTARNSETGEIVTPKYKEGVCQGEYDTDTGEFIPHTNPMIIPKGQVMYVDEDQEAFINGKHKTTVTGIVEDNGADIARKHMVAMTDSVKQSKPKLYLPETAVIPKEEIREINGVSLDRIF